MRRITGYGAVLNLLVLLAVAVNLRPGVSSVGVALLSLPSLSSG
ncbi:hypothetical protein [Streptomyces sp. CA-106110]